MSNAISHLVVECTCHYIGEYIYYNTNPGIADACMNARTHTDSRQRTNTSCDQEKSYKIYESLYESRFFAKTATGPTKCSWFLHAIPGFRHF